MAFFQASPSSPGQLTVHAAQRQARRAQKELLALGLSLKLTESQALLARIFGVSHWHVLLHILKTGQGPSPKSGAHAQSTCGDLPDPMPIQGSDLLLERLRHQLSQGLRSWTLRTGDVAKGFTEDGQMQLLNEVPLPSDAVINLYRWLFQPLDDLATSFTQLARERHIEVTRQVKFSDQSTVEMRGCLDLDPEHGQPVFHLQSRQWTAPPTLPLKWPIELHQLLRQRLGKVTLITADFPEEIQSELEGILAMGLHEQDHVELVHHVKTRGTWPEHPHLHATVYEEYPPLMFAQISQPHQLLVLDQWHDERDLQGLLRLAERQRTSYAGSTAGTLNRLVEDLIENLCYLNPASVFQLFRSLHLLVAHSRHMDRSGEVKPHYDWLHVDHVFLQQLQHVLTPDWRMDDLFHLIQVTQARQGGRPPRD